MKPNPLFNGLYVPLVTPFTNDLRLAPDALARLADEALSAGASDSSPSVPPRNQPP